MRLQTIVSREVDPSDFAVVTVAAIKAGDAENIIPNEATLKIDVRAALPQTRERVLAAIETIIQAEARASSNPLPPILTPTTQFPLLFNDYEITSAIETSFAEHFGTKYQNDITSVEGSEDFGILATAIDRPSCFFVYGGIDPELYDKAEQEGRLDEDIPGNHSPLFAPVIQPTLKCGVDGYTVAALTFLRK
jgi:metal-dependent amidase/aminoacylase/carboxypeptidase family protein